MKTAPVACQCCKKATASHLVKDYAHHTYWVCRGCLKILNADHGRTGQSPIVLERSPSEKARLEHERREDMEFERMMMG